MTRFTNKEKMILLRKKCFNYSQIKQELGTSKSTTRTYKGMFQHGTCVVAYHDRDMHDYVLGGIEYLRKRYSR